MNILLSNYIMNCNTCLVGITLLFSSVYMTMLKKDNRIFIDFMNMLNKEQKQIYHSIVIERITAYLVGMLLGIGLGLSYYYTYPKQKYPLCSFLAIAYVTKLVTYYFWPKSPLMLYSLTSKEQTDAWATIYEEMKYRYKISLVLGFIGYLLLFSNIKN
jgi:hypothetical protein